MHRSALRVETEVQLNISDAFQQKKMPMGENEFKALICATKILHFLISHNLPYTTLFKDFVNFATNELQCQDLQHLKQGKNATYTSPTIADEFMDSMATDIEETVKQRVKDSPGYAIMSDETTDVSNNKHLAFCVKYINTENGDACIDYLKDVKITDGKAETIFKETEKVVEELGLSNFVGYASDGCQTMIGKKTGVATRLKAIKPGLVTVHCHNHRLALAAKDSFESIPLMRDTDDLLNHVFKYYHYSANKTASLQKIHTMLEEKGKTIKQAGHTRWLSHKAAVTSLRDCYKAVLIDLENAEASGADKVRMGSGPSASGLLKKLKNPATAKIVHFLCDALRPLTALTLVFERNDINLSVIKPRKDSTISGLKNLKETYGSSERKCDKLLADLGLEATEQQLKSVHTARTMFLDKLVDNINVRLASSDVIDQLAVFNMDETETFYGNDEIACLADNFGLDADEVTEEWDDFKNAISSTSPEVIRGPHRLIKAMMKIRPHKFPNIERLCATAVVVPVSTAEVERVFSELARTKTDLRNRLQVDTVHQLLMINRNDKYLAFDKCVRRWYKMKNRRI
ncbi:zinc finger protein 862-like [Mya arenaria]|uniref:zinc finger protein 862-like n=1 Tax=Mya arenaria TaxID=6604 RepID=UPI0022E8CA39|nr:zinc finger protein 862-like [Mya arenaria]